MCDSTNLRLVSNSETEELADIRLPRVRRAELKALAFDLADYQCNNVDEIVFLSGALEDAARRKRGEDV